MFRNTITTPLTGFAAKQFGNVVVGDMPDNTLETTLRMLLSKRTNDPLFVHIKDAYANKRWSLYDFTKWTDYENRNHMEIISITPESGSEEDIKNTINDFSHHNFIEVKNIHEFFKKQFFCKTYINAETKSTLVFMSPGNIEYFHYLQCAIPAMMPWYFSENKPNDKEMELISSLRERTPEKYLALVREFIDVNNTRDLIIKNCLESFENKFSKQTMDNILRDIERINNDISRYELALKDLIVQKRDKNILMSGLMRADTKESELMDYFLSNKHLSISNVNNGNITFVVKNELSIFDEDAALTIIDSRGSTLYYHIPMAKIDDYALLLRAIISGRYKLNLCAAYTITDDGRITSNAHYHYGADTESLYLPNPHTNAYSCMGDYVGMISEALQENDYIKAVSICENSCISINFCDAPVMRVFGESLYNSTGKVITTDENECITVDAAIKLLKEEQTNG